MRIEYDFDIVGGEFDGAPALAWIDDGKHPPPELIFVGVCDVGTHCGSRKCSRQVAHVSYWTPDEARPTGAQPYPKQSEFVRTEVQSGEMSGRAVYAIGGLTDPKNFGERAREPVGVGASDPLVTAYGDPDDVLMQIVRDSWAGAGHDARRTQPYYDREAEEARRAFLGPEYFGLSWVPPWRKGLPQRDCSACGSRCVERTLDDDARCVQCVSRGKFPEPETPEALAFDFGAPA